MAEDRSSGPRVALQLAACIAALRAGQVGPCLGALVELHDWIQDRKADQADQLDRALSTEPPVPGIDYLQDEPFIWDDPCRRFE